jgi:hypothetical protein
VGHNVPLLLTEDAMEDREQVEYLGRFVDKKTFRTNVYDANGKKKLAESWKEYQELIGSGIFYNTIADIPSKKEKKIKKTRQLKGDVLKI